MKSVMNGSSHTFSQVPKADIQRSSFDRSHGYKTTFDSGNLIPIFVDEALPGDTFNLNMTVFARLNTPIVPIMDNLNLDSFFFAVPYRLVWDNWKKFNGEQINPGDSTDYIVPQIVAPTSSPIGFQQGTLEDYFGIPTLVPTLSVSCLWHRAYNLIWNEWFRDQNMQNSLVVPKGDGPDSVLNYAIQKRGKRHDYFTSCLPWPQKGPAVTLPLGTSAPVYGATLAGTTVPTGITLWQARSAPGGVTGADKAFVNSSAPPGSTFYGNTNLVNREGLSLATKAQYTTYGSNATPPYADLTAATAATINALRQAFQIQKLYERDARGGTRYTEIIRAHFGVTSPDARQQRPEYLGGGSSPVAINPVTQTAPTETGVTPQGNLAATGTISARNAGFTKSFTEHCLIIGLIAVRADLNYQQGLNRMFSRRTRWDFFWPALAHIGEQAVLNKEIYAQGPAVTNANGPLDEQAFGYQERYAEYRYKPSQITGQFRSNYAQSLDIWHLAQDFASLPTLSSAFIEDRPPVDRIIATPTEPQWKLDSYFKFTCARPMPVYSVPGLVDHF